MAIKVNGVTVIHDNKSIDTGTSTINGRNLANDGAKLDNISSGATDNTVANAALPKAGGIMAGRLVLSDAGYSIGDEYHTWKRNYVVNGSSPQELLYHDGTSLPAGGAYRFHAHVYATGTDQSATAVYWNQNGTWKVNVTHQSGVSSNCPEFIIAGSPERPTIHIDHANDYTIAVLAERLELSEGTGTDNLAGFGTDAYLGSVGGVLRYNNAGSGNTYAQGNTVFHDGYHPNADDADTLDGQHGSYYTGYTDTAITNLVDSSPATLDTLNELAAALGDDPNFATTVSTNIGGKVSKSGDTITSGTSTGLTINHNTFANGLVIHRNDTSNSPAIKFKNNAGEVGILYANSLTKTPIWRPGGTTNNFTIFTENYHPNADKWTTARTLSLSGDASGSVSWDGSANATLSVTVANDSHTHDGRYYTETEADSRFVYASGDTMTGNLAVSIPDNGGAPAMTAEFKLHGYEGRGAGISIKDSANSASGATNREWFIGSGYSQSGFNIGYSSTGSQTSYAAQNKLSLNTAGDAVFSGTIHAQTNQRVFADNYHPNADKWTTARTLSLSGDASGSVSWDGSANATLSVTVNNDSHSHSNYVPYSTAGSYPYFATGDWIRMPSNGLGILPYSNGNSYVGTSSWRFGQGWFNQLNGGTPWTSANDGSGSGLDADLLDGVQGSSFLRSDATDYINGVLYTRADIRNEDGYRDHGVYGHYDSNKTNHIWSMGSGYRSSAAGTDFGNLYGLAYKHTNNPTGGTMASGHQMVWCQNGTPNSAIGTNIWTSGVVTSANMYVSGNIYHTGDTNTYMGFHVNDQWRVVTGGVERLEVNNDNTIMATNLVMNSHNIDMDLNNVDTNAIDMEDVRSSSWPLNFTTNAVGNDNDSGFWVGSNGYPDMRLRRENGTVRALISSWETSYVSNGFDVLSGNLTVAGSTVWHAGNDGSGSGLDADLLDGVQGSSFLRSDASDTATGAITLRNDNGLFIQSATNGLGAKVKFSDHGSGSYAQFGTIEYRHSDSYWDSYSGLTGCGDGFHFKGTEPSTGFYFEGPTSVSGDLIITGNILHNGDTNTWMGFHATDQWRVVTGGSERLEVNNTHVYAVVQIRSSSNITAYYSDMRLKTKTSTIDDALGKVSSLEGFYYVENEVARENGYNNDEQQVALSAQAVQAVMPEAIHPAPFDVGIDEDGNEYSKSGENYLTVDYARLVPLLVEAIKELKSEVEELKSKIEV